jgi:hypothetical protein
MRALAVCNTAGCKYGIVYYCYAENDPSCSTGSCEHDDCWGQNWCGLSCYTFCVSPAYECRYPSCSVYVSCCGYECD